MDIGDIYIGTDKSLEEQVQAIYRYCQEFHSDSVLLAALGSLEENVVVVECNEVYLRGGAK